MLIGRAIIKSIVLTLSWIGYLFSLSPSYGGTYERLRGIKRERKMRKRERR
jgi:hypothetical protein